MLDAAEGQRSRPNGPGLQARLRRLRSGGPEMTIESIEDNGDLNCAWFTVTYDGKWEIPTRSRFIADSVQLAADGDLVDSERGIPWDIHSRAKPRRDEETELETRVRERTEAKAAIAEAKAGKIKP